MAFRSIDCPLAIIRLREWMRLAGLQSFVVRRLSPDDGKYGGRWYLEVETDKRAGGRNGVLTKTMSNLKKFGVYDGWTKTQFGSGYQGDKIWVKFGIQVDHDIGPYLLGGHSLVEGITDD